MTQAFFPVGFRATDADDNPLAGGYLLYFEAGTTTPLEVYSEEYVDENTPSLGTRVDLNSSGMPVDGSNVPTMIYPGPGSYKARLYAANDTLIVEQDDLPGHVEPPEAATTALPTTPVISKTGAYTVTVAERGKLINANPTGGSFAITMPSAVTMGDNFRVGVRHAGSANQVSVVASGGQFIRAHKALRSYPLTGMGETIWLVSDGSDWVVDSYHPPFWKADSPYFIVLDRLTAPPANPDAGARYLINGEPTGLWASLSFEEHDIAEADGNGSWIQHTPESGWRAFDRDEEQSLVFRDGQWENFQVDPGTSVLKQLWAQDQRTGSSAGTATTGAWTTSVFNTSLVNTIDDASLAANTFTLPAGTYEVDAQKTFLMTKLSKIRFRAVDDSIDPIYGVQAYIGDYDANSDQRTETGGILTLKGRFTITESTDFVLEYRVSEEPSGSFDGLGNLTGVNPEVYANIVITDLSSLQGPKGDQGDQGNTGSNGIAGVAGPTASTAFDFDDNTSDADPGNGQLRLNHASFASATACYIDNLNRAGATVSGWLDAFDDGGSSLIRGILLIQKAASAQVDFCLYTVSGSVVDGTGYRKLTIAHLASNGSFTNADELVVAFFSAGPPGSLEAGSTIDLNGNNITGTGNIDIVGTVSQSGVAISPVGKQTLYIPAAAWNPTITNGAGRTYEELATNDLIRETLDFDTTTQEFATYAMPFPKKWNAGTITYTVHWAAASGTPAQTVDWALAAVAISNDDASDAAPGTPVVVSDALIATTDHHITAESGAVTIGGTPAKGDFIVFKIQRDVSTDNLSADAKLIGVEIHWTPDAATDA
jgi:hypothetical protein